MSHIHIIIMTGLSIFLAACSTRYSTIPADSFQNIGEGEIPSHIIVTGDDTVYGIAYKYGLSTRTLIAANDLKPPYALVPGQMLVLPQANQYVVRAGETLEGIAQDMGVQVEVLARENHLSVPYYVTAGDRLIIPPKDTSSFEDALQPQDNVIATSSLEPLAIVAQKPEKLQSTEFQPLPEDIAAELAREKGKVKNESESKNSPKLINGTLKGSVSKNKITQEGLEPLEIDPKEKTPDIKESKPLQKIEKTTEAKSFDKHAKPGTLFNWPLKGKVVSKFGSQGANNGIKIAVSEGTTVRASAAGEVFYADKGLKEYGNLILIKHKDGWITAYGNNSKLLVNKGDKVVQGQEIAKSGQTGDAKTPQLHFEIRKMKQPIDPLTKLGS